MRGTRVVSAGLAVIACALGACTAPGGGEGPAPPAADMAAGPAGGIDGFWRTENYGSLLEIEGPRGQYFETTEISCLPGFELEVLPPRDEDTEALLVLVRHGIEIDVQPGAGDEDRWLRFDALASRRHIFRIENLPESCRTLGPADPLSVFDVFRQTFAERYPFFAMKGIDWEEVGARERARLTSDTSSEELFEVLAGMIAPLEDAHTFLSAPELEKTFWGSRPSPHPLDDEAVARAWRIVDESYLTEPPETSCNEQVAVGRLEGGVRYLRLRSFSGFGDDIGSGLSCLEAALDRLLADSDGISGVILDVRINDGGFDPYGLAVASRFAADEYLAYAKQTWTDPGDPDDWSPKQPIMVEPSDRERFEGPVAILIGPRSISAAEAFTMALMGRAPRVTRIGANTQGVFSDMLWRTLPNGWKFGLPNERFLTYDGRSFDGPGISPDVPTPVFSPQELESGVDSALEKALEVLLESGESSS